MGEATGLWRMAFFVLTHYASCRLHDLHYRRKCKN